MLTIGDTVPDFELLNQDNQPVRLSAFRGQRLVLFTFAKAGTMGCTMQACSMRDALPQIATSDAVVLGLGGDKPADLKNWQRRDHLPYDLLYDPDHAVLSQLGGWGMTMLGINLPIGKHTLWVLDENGVIIARHVPVAPFEIARRALEALNTYTAATQAR